MIDLISRIFFLPFSFRINRDSQLKVEDIQNWEQIHGKIPDGAIMIVYSGNGQNYSNKTAYFGWPLGTEETNPKDTENLHFPGIRPETAEWIVQNRNIYGAGIDTASIDYGQSKDFKTHQIFAANNIWNLENLNNVDKLPPKGFYVYNMVYKGREGSGGPSRVIAIFDKSTNNSPSNAKSSLILSTAMLLLLRVLNIL